MDRPYRKPIARLMLASALAATVGCVAPATPVPTVWQKLGIPQATARLRDATVNRNGNFPQLEKKPPLLKLADPANFAPEKPEMIKAAAKIKADQDLKKQKIKALKFLAEVSCGCYNKDKAVEKAFLAALEDCDPDVKLAAIDAIGATVGCSCKCGNGCETSCCTEDLVKKLKDVAYGVENGCFKEPNKEIRNAAANVMCKCPSPKMNPIEEIPLPTELPPDVDTNKDLQKDNVVEPPKDLSYSEPTEISSRKSNRYQLAFKISDEEESAPVLLPSTGNVVTASDIQPVIIDDGLEPAPIKTESAPKPKTVAKPTAVTSESRTVDSQSIANPKDLVSAQVVSYRNNLGEVLVSLPDSFELRKGWQMVVVDGSGKHAFGQISDCGGRRLLIALDNLDVLNLKDGDSVRVGIVKK